MDLRLVAVLLLVPVLDFLLLVGLVAVGPLTVVQGVLVVVVTSLVGLLLVRAEGRHTVRKIQRSLAGATSRATSCWTARSSSWPPGSSSRRGS